MEPYRKRQRIYSPHRPDFPQSFGNQHAHYYRENIDGRDDLNDYEYSDDGEQFVDEGTVDNDLRVTDFDLQQKRAQVDFKLKSAYESIFEKYGRDFEGIGDEIDMETGEIVVNNGHLHEMQNERDIGKTHRRHYQSLDESTDVENSEGSSGLEESGSEEDQSEEEDDEEDEDEATKDDGSGDDMMEDDLILRGFTQATRGRLTQPSAHHSHPPSRPVKASQSSHIAHPRAQTQVFPSRSQIIAQFGSQLGPQIVDVVARQNGHAASGKDRSVEAAWHLPPDLEQRYARKDRIVEPAWSAPDIPAFYLTSRRLAKPYTANLDKQRSPSPEAGYSLWAASSNRPSKDHGKHSINPNRKRVRNNFTVADNEALLDCVKKARLRGIKLNQSFWLGLAAQYPNHAAQSWQRHYNRKYSYLEPDQDLRSEKVESSAVSFQPMNTHQSKLNIREPGLFHSSTFNSRQQRPADMRPPPRPVGNNDGRRSMRARKPAQRDSEVISWSQAVDTIKALDPTLHAGILEDTKSNLDAEGSRHWQQPSFSRGARRVSDQVQNIKRSNYTGPDSGYETQRMRRYSDSAQSYDIHAHDYNHSQSTNYESAPCPHIDCRGYRSVLYRQERTIEEDQSELSFHLLNAHHTTPYPCREPNCINKGENGYFVYDDLLEHVQHSHPSLEALQRVRGRAVLGFHVDPKAATTRQSRTYDSASSSRAQGSRVLSSSHLASSSSDLDRTLTPGALAGASTYTPMTSISSLVVNHSSAKTDLEANESNSRSPTAAPQRNNNHPETPRFVLRSPESGTHEQESAEKLPRQAFGSPDLSLPVTGGDKSFSSTAGILGSVEPATPSSMQFLPSIKSGPDMLFSQRSSLPSSIPDSQASPERRLQYLASQINPEDVSASKGPDLSVLEDVARLPKSKDVTPSPMLPPPKLKSTAARRLFDTTHHKHKQDPKSFNSRGLDDIDELSLSTNGFVLLSSRAKTARPSVDLAIRVKREETADVPQVIPVATAPSLKRKHEVFQGDDEIDELMADEPNFSVSILGTSSRRKPKIKSEDSEPTPYFPTRNIVNRKIKKSKQRKGLGIPRSAIAEFSSATRGRSHDIDQAIDYPRSTPLLDLPVARDITTDKSVAREIAESGAGSSSQIIITKAKGDGSSSPMNQLLTPVRQIRHYSKTEGPIITIKTPGGTLRKCGENGFMCKRSFCFRCGTKVTKGSGRITERKG